MKRIASSWKHRIGQAFFSGDARFARVKKNIASSLMLRGGSIALSLISVPLGISYVGSSSYGVWLTLSSIINWFSLADIGLGLGLRNKLTASIAAGDTKSSRIYVSTTFAILVLIGFFVFAAFYLLSSKIHWNSILNTDKIAGSELRLLGLIVCGSLSLQLTIQIYNSTLSALQQTSVTAAVSAAGQLLGTILLVVAVQVNRQGSLVSLALIGTVAPLAVQALAASTFFKFQRPDLRPNFTNIDLREGAQLLQLGGAFFFVQVGGLLLFQTDNIIIARVLDPEQVTIFGVCFKLFSLISFIFTIAMTPLWPAFGEAYANKEMNWIETVFRKMYRLLTYAALTTIALTIASPYIFELWVGKYLAISWGLRLAMGLYVFGICWMSVPCYLVNGLSKIKLQLILYIFASIINIPMAVLFAHRWGAAGVVSANLLIVTLMGLILKIQCEKIIKGTATGLWNR